VNYPFNFTTTTCIYPLIIQKKVLKVVTGVSPLLLTLVLTCKATDNFWYFWLRDSPVLLLLEYLKHVL